MIGGQFMIKKTLAPPSEVDLELPELYINI